MGGRTARIWLSAGSSAAARAVSIAVSLVTVPLLLAHLGKEGYGLLTAITSAALMFGFSDLGLGNAVMNAVADADGRCNLKALERVVSSGLAVLGLSVLAALAVVGALARFVDWGSLLNASDPRLQAALPAAVLAVGSCVAVNTLLSLPQRVQQGLQRGYETSAWQAAASVAMLALLLAAVRHGASMALVGAVLVGSPALGASVTALRLWRQVPDARPTWRGVDGEVMRSLLRSGMAFLWLQFCHVLATAMDALIIARVLGPAVSAEYAVAARLFTIVPVLLSFVQIPLWPAYREALTKGDHSWVGRTAARALVVTALVAGTLSFGLLAFGRPLLKLWVGAAVEPDATLLAGLAVWFWLYTTGNALTMLMHAGGRLRFQSVVWGLFALVTVTTKVLFGQRLGISLFPWVSAAAYVAVIGVPMLVVARGLLSRRGPSVVTAPGAD